MSNELKIQRFPFKSIEDMHHVIHGADLDSVQLNPDGTPTGGIIYAAVGDVILSTGHFRANVRSRGIMDPNRVTLGVHFSTNANLSQWGVESLAGDIFAFAPGGEEDGMSAGDISFATVSFSPETLLKLGVNDALIRDRAFWEYQHRFRALPQVRNTICKSLMEISSRLMSPGLAIADKQIESLQHELLELFFRGIVFDEKLPQDRHGHSSAVIVRKVEDWVSERRPESIHISDLCKALYVSRRTLQRAFTETLGMGPAHYLMLKRLSAVRFVLRTADPQTTSVTKVATEHGFWELGRFTLMYKRMFGERPSDTLNQRFQSSWRIGKSGIWRNLHSQ
jgi:AraC family ethanolamine operon transcriptional activator